MSLTGSSVTATARTSFISQPNNVNGAGPSSSAPAGMSPELEQTLTLLSSHRSVLGYMLLSRSHPVSIIRHSGVVFDGEQGKRYAGVISRIVESVQTGLEDIVEPGREYDAVDDLRFLRIRTKRHEIMISPDDSSPS